MVYKNPDSVIAQTTEKTLEKIRQRDHIFVSGVFKDRDSTLVVYCPEHEVTHSTTFYNYNRSKTGMQCCGDASKSEKLTGREYTPETLANMRVGSSKRPDRGGKPRRWRENAAYRNWRKGVLSLRGACCAITAETSKLVVHHLISAHTCFHLVYEPLNGIVLTEELHVKFHNSFGYTQNTPEEFIQFLGSLLQNETLSTPISSQASRGREEGSETRVYDPARIMELQERLGEVSKTLAQLLAVAKEREQK